MSTPSHSTTTRVATISGETYQSSYSARLAGSRVSQSATSGSLR